MIVNTKAVIVALVCIGAASAIGDSKWVKQLTPDNFDAELAASNGALVEFYAPWCGHCKNLAPEYEKLGAAFASSRDVLIAKVDADEHRSLGSRFGVTGFPTLKWFPKGSTEPVDYEGGRTADALVAFVTEKTGVVGKIKEEPSDVVALTPDTFSKVVKGASAGALVEFYAPWCGHCKALAPEYEKVGTAFAREDGVVVAKVDCDAHKDIANRYNIQGFPTLKWFPAGSVDAADAEDYQEARQAASLVAFLNKKSGAERTEAGELSQGAGRVEALDKLAREFMSTPKFREQIVEKAKEALEGLEESRYSSMGQYYIKAMEKTMAKGDEHPVNEKARLGRLMLGDSVTAEKADEFTMRRNILTAFMEE